MPQPTAQNSNNESLKIPIFLQRKFCSWDEKEFLAVAVYHQWFSRWISIFIPWWKMRIYSQPTRHNNCSIPHQYEQWQRHLDCAFEKKSNVELSDIKNSTRKIPFQHSTEVWFCMYLSLCVFLSESYRLLQEH